MEIHDKVEKVPTDQLKPYYNNPKAHPPEQLENIKESIIEYGFTVPLIIDGDKEIIAGHGRLAAAKELNIKELPCIKRDDLTEEEARALRIADNKVAEITRMALAYFFENIEVK